VDNVKFFNSVEEAFEWLKADESNGTVRDLTNSPQVK
jgi:hypothetical protein